MSTFAYDTVVYGSSEWGVVFAVAAAADGARVGLVSESNTIGGMTAGSLGVLDISGAAMLAAMRGGEWGRFVRKSAFAMGLRDTRLVVPGAAEREFVDMLARAGVTVHRAQRLASAVTDGSGKITSMTTIAGDVFQAATWFDASMCSDLVQAAGTEGTTWAIGTEDADAYAESKGGYTQAAAAGNPYVGASLNPLVMPGPLAHAAGDAYDGVQAYAHRVVYAPAVSGDYTPFASARITPLGGGPSVLVTDPGHYDPDLLAFYCTVLRAGERNVPVDGLTGGGRGFLPNGLIQDNDDIPLVAAGVPRHWSYGRFNPADPAATYAARAQLEYDAKLFTMQSRAFMATDSRYSGAWQDSAAGWGWPLREFRANNGIPWQFYVREAARPLGHYTLAQDDLTVEAEGAGRNIHKADGIALAGFSFDTHIAAYAADGASEAQYYEIGQATHGAPDTSVRGYAIPWTACWHEDVPNLMHVPGSSHLAWSSIRLVQTLCLSANACGVANRELLLGTAPDALDVAALRVRLAASSLLYAPLAA